MPLLTLLTELFIPIAASILGAGSWLWAKHIKKHAHDKAA